MEAQREKTITEWMMILQRYLETFRTNSRDESFASSMTNQIFHYAGCTTRKRITNLGGSSTRHCVRETQLLSKKCCRDGEPLATLCPF